MSFLELVTSDFSCIKRVKLQLESHKAFVAPIFTLEDGRKVIRANLEADSWVIREIIQQYEVKVNEGAVLSDLIADQSFSCTEHVVNSSNLKCFISRFMQQNNFTASEIRALLDTSPLRYKLYEPLVLFSYSLKRSFDHPQWKQAFNKLSKEAFFATMLRSRAFGRGKFSHVAMDMPIVPGDTMRRPLNIMPLYGSLYHGKELTDQIWDSPTYTDFRNAVWCSVIQNGIKQIWCPVFTMFSRGNIREKTRILDSYRDIETHDVVDLYAGIGYFTFFYLKRKARYVFCFELNPWSVEGLRRGLAINSFQGQCFIYQQNNNTALIELEKHQKNSLDVRHINLGLLPSSQPSWEIALEIAERYGCKPISTLHIHSNVHLNDLEDRTFELRTHAAFAALAPPALSVHIAQVARVKTFAPDIWHTVLDLDIERLKTI